MLVALHTDGDACMTVGERYATAKVDLTCTKDRAGATLWMTKSKADKLASRAAGAAPVYRGQPGYGPHLDRDNDGIGCE